MKYKIKSIIRDGVYYYNQFKIEEELFNYYSLHNTFEDDANVISVIKNLDIFFSIWRLEYACFEKFQSRFSDVNISDKISMADSVIDFIEKSGNDLSVPILKLYRV
ncbi:MAG: hypothetical protein IPL65_02615 [Lewinellaceae bacterium]|nr:hypothetical protein [Lewinellaceae bacterium]